MSTPCAAFLETNIDRVAVLHPKQCRVLAIFKLEDVSHDNQVQE